MAQQRYESRRVFAHKVGRMYGGQNPVPRGKTEEQKEADQKATQASYEVWKAKREARLARLRNIRL